MDDHLAASVRTAHGDAWEVEARTRAPYGGGWARVRGARLMASGLARAKWNNADVTAADADLDAVSDWYRARDVPWGIRVPLELEVALGAPLFVKRCVGITADAFEDPGAPSSVRAAGPDELELVARLDAMGGDLDESRAWVRPQLGTPGFRHWIAETDAGPVGLATTVRSDGDAGAAAYLTGVFASDPVVLDALVARAAADAFADGARLVHANPDDDTEAARLLALGGVEVPGFEVRVVRPDAIS